MQEETLPKSAMRSLLVSRKFGVREMGPEGCGRDPGDRLFYDLVDDKLQVYRERKGKSVFVWIRRNALSFKKCPQNPMMVEILSQEEVSLRLMGFLDFNYALPRTFLDKKNVFWSPKVEDSLSVDLTTFPGNLLRQRDQGGVGHPKVRKTPILAVEVFGVRDGQPAYADVLVGNEAELAGEVESSNFLDDDDDEGGNDEEEEGENRERMLMEIVEEEEGEGSDPAFVCRLLETLVAEASPACSGMEALEARLTEVIRKLDPSGWNLVDRVRVAVSLTRLGLVGGKWKLRTKHTYIQVGNRATCCYLCQDALASWMLPREEQYRTDLLTDLLLALSQWQLCFYLDAGTVLQVVRMVREAAEKETNLPAEEKYVLDIVWAAVVEFLNDVTLVKETIGERGLDRVKIDTVRVSFNATK